MAIKVGQRLLTSSLEEVLVLQVKDISLFLVSCGEKEFILSPYEIFAVILDVTSPETEDVGYVQLRVEDTRKTRPTLAKSGAGFFRFGARASWTVGLGGADLTIRGFVLKESPYLTVLSELGVSQPDRTWVVPTHLLEVCLNIDG
tara:strand:+ start:6517 stop:6951 length:435 start_codon:yes stop_codon:yes gene_type:complete